MKALLVSIALLLLAGTRLVAQESLPPDKITLTNGDVLSGTIKSMTDGEIVLTTKALGDVKVKLADVQDLATGGPVVLQTKSQERLNRRVIGIKDGQLQLGESAAPGPAVSTLPVDALDKINPSGPKWEGSVTFGAYLLTGNTDRRGANGDLTAVRRADMDRLNFNAWWEYAEDKDAATLDWVLLQRRTGAQVKYDYFLSKKSYLWVNTAAEGDYNANLKLRYTIGAGYGYQWIETDRTKFGTELGLAYFSEDYRDTTPTKEYLAARAAYKLEHKITDTLSFWQQVEAFPSLERASDFYGRADTRLIAKLTDHMVAQAKVIVDYNTSPAAGKESLDVGYYLTVGWTF